MEDKARDEGADDGLRGVFERTSIFSDDELCAVDILQVMTGDDVLRCLKGL